MVKTILILAAQGYHHCSKNWLKTESSQSITQQKSDGKEPVSHQKSEFVSQKSVPNLRPSSQFHRFFVVKGRRTVLVKKSLSLSHFSARQTYQIYQGLKLQAVRFDLAKEIT